VIVARYGVVPKGMSGASQFAEFLRSTRVIDANVHASLQMVERIGHACVHLEQERLEQNGLAVVTPGAAVQVVAALTQVLVWFHATYAPQT